MMNNEDAAPAQTDEDVLIAIVTAKPVILRRMSDARRAPEGFHLGLADRMARECKIGKRWDSKVKGFVYSALDA